VLDNEMIKAIGTLIREPSGERYLEAVRLYVASDVYDPDSMDVNDVDRLCELERFRDAVQRFVEVVPGWILSPRVHSLAGVAYQLAGDSAMAKLELQLSSALVTGILRTGSGTPDSPFVVTRLADEYDVIGYQISPESGELTREPVLSLERRLDQIEEGRWVETHKLSDGTEVSFDVSMEMAHYDKKRVILRSGDGRENSPYRLLSRADELEIARYVLRPTPASERRVETDDRRFDVYAYDDGAELWFDVTETPRWA
jgi:hypothetical protein